MVGLETQWVNFVLDADIFTLKTNNLHRQLMVHIERRLQQLGIVLPEAPQPLGNFAPYMINRDDLHISGQVSAMPDGQIIQGELGSEVSISKGIEAARYCATGILARAKSAIDDLDRIQKLVKLGVFINADTDFTDHPKIANGASDLMVEIFGAEKANHVRFAVGCASLPQNATVEIEAIFRVCSENR